MIARTEAHVTCGLANNYASTGSISFIINRFKAFSSENETGSLIPHHKLIALRKQFRQSCQEVPVAGRVIAPNRIQNDGERLLLAPDCSGASLTKTGKQLAAIWITRPRFRMPLHRDRETISLNRFDNAIRRLRRNDQAISELLGALMMTGIGLDAIGVDYLMQSGARNDLNLMPRRKIQFTNLSVIGSPRHL